MSSKPETCCGKSEVCVCAQQATCSCGAKPALQCNCEKAATENAVSGNRCSCQARPAGKCNCARAEAENKKPCGDACDCGCKVSGEYRDRQTCDTEIGLGMVG
ncbi:hypothetical protein VTJ49DRAFT_7550 [Mycothermus thermophilus]|uniref:DUF7871 domain-containing protein n=1 Tax=Humicola insolens TaxID=85995 RepID=A0ABR3VGX4_HUMIN